MSGILSQRTPRRPESAPGIQHLRARTDVRRIQHFPCQLGGVTAQLHGQPPFQSQCPVAPPFDTGPGRPDQRRILPVSGQKRCATGTQIPPRQYLSAR